MAEKKSKTTSRRIIQIDNDTLHDCLSSWLTATRVIEKNEFVTLVISSKDIEMGKYLVEIRNAS